MMEEPKFWSNNFEKTGEYPSMLKLVEDHASFPKFDYVYVGATSDSDVQGYVRKKLKTDCKEKVYGNILEV